MLREQNHSQRETLGVVVLAHDGGAILAKTLEGLGQQQDPANHPVHLVIAVNGGTRETLAIANGASRQLSARGWSVAVVQTAAGRFNALNAAEQLLPSGPRIYVDQDASLSRTAFADLSHALQDGGCWHFAAPVLELGKPSNLFTRWYYQMWSHLPYVQASPVTIGLYGISAQCRLRWKSFPDLSNDDKFARLHTAPGERTLVRSATYTVNLPRGFRALTAARSRYIRYNAELRKAFPSLQQNDIPRYVGTLRTIANDRRLWLPAVVFSAVHAAATVRAWFAALRAHRKCLTDAAERPAQADLPASEQPT